VKDRDRDPPRYQHGKGPDGRTWNAGASSTWTREPANALILKEKLDLESITDRDDQSNFKIRHEVRVRILSELLNWPLARQPRSTFVGTRGGISALSSLTDCQSWTGRRAIIPPPGNVCCAGVASDPHALPIIGRLRKFVRH
jgi:hypothetical protein